MHGQGHRLKVGGLQLVEDKGGVRGQPQESEALIDSLQGECVTPGGAVGVGQECSCLEGGRVPGVGKPGQQVSRLGRQLLRPLVVPLLQAKEHEVIDAQDDQRVDVGIEFSLHRERFLETRTGLVPLLQGVVGQSQLGQGLGRFPDGRTEDLPQRLQRLPVILERLDVIALLVADDAEVGEADRHVAVWPVAVELSLHGQILKVIVPGPGKFPLGPIDIGDLTQAGGGERVELAVQDLPLPQRLLLQRHGLLVLAPVHMADAQDVQEVGHGVEHHAVKLPPDSQRRWK